MLEGLKAMDLMESDFVSASEDNFVSAVIGKLQKTNSLKAIIIGRELEYVGVFGKGLLFKSMVDASKLSVSKVSERIPAVSEFENAERIINLMLSSDSVIIPVVKDNKPVGIVSASSLLPFFKKIPEFSALKAASLSNPLLALPQTSSLKKALNLMRENNFSRIAVVDNNGKLQGIARFSDILFSFLSKPPERVGGGRGKGKAFSPEKIPRLELPVSNALTGFCGSVSSSDSIIKAIDLMLSKNLPEVIVTDGLKPVGIITLKDFLLFYARLKPLDRKLRLINFPELDEVDAKEARTAIDESTEKISKITHAEPEFSIQVKTYHKTGGRKQFEVHCTLKAPSIFLTAKAVEWNFLTALQKALKELKREVIKKFKR